MNGVHLDIAEWKQKKELERGAIAAAQQMALRQVIQNGETLGRYLLGRGRLASKLTSGNTALVLQEFPDSQAALTFQEWQTFGRNISKSAKGVSILTQQDGYLTVEKVFDLSQTYGNKPYPLVLLTAGEDYMQKALEALAPFCPVPIRKSKEIAHSVLFASERQAILYRPDATEQQRFRYLPGAILQAYAEYYEPGVSQADQVQFYSLAICIELCGRFGIAPPEGYIVKLEKYIPLFKSEDARKVLEDIRELSRTMGDCVQKALPEKESPQFPMPETIL